MSFKVPNESSGLLLHPAQVKLSVTLRHSVSLLHIVFILKHKLKAGISLQMQQSYLVRIHLFYESTRTERCNKVYLEAQRLSTQEGKRKAPCNTWAAGRKSSCAPKSGLGISGHPQRNIWGKGKGDGTGSSSQGEYGTKL